MAGSGTVSPNRREFPERVEHLKPKAVPDPASQVFCQNFSDHDFAEEYYGYKCRNCDLFYAFGQAPWEEGISDEGLKDESF